MYKLFNTFDVIEFEPTRTASLRVCVNRHDLVDHEVIRGAQSEHERL